MGDAEEALRRQAKEQQALEQHAQAAQRARADSEAERLALQADQLIPRALTALREAGYPGGRLITVRGKLGRKTEIAAWQVGKYSVWDRDSHVDHDIWLLSNGRFTFAEPYSGYRYRQWTFRDLCQQHRSTAYDVIRSLEALAKTELA